MIQVRHAQGRRTKPARRHGIQLRQSRDVVRSQGRRQGGGSQDGDLQGHLVQAAELRTEGMHRDQLRGEHRRVRQRRWRQRLNWQRRARRNDPGGKVSRGRGQDQHRVGPRADVVEVTERKVPAKNALHRQVVHHQPGHAELQRVDLQVAGVLATDIHAARVSTDQARACIRAHLGALSRGQALRIDQAEG